MKDSQGKPSAALAAAFQKMPAPTPQAAEPLCKDLLAGEAKIIGELVACVGESFGDAGGVKAKYALHALAVYSARPGASADRKMVAEALVKHLEANHSEDLKAFIIRQLQWCGRAEEVPALAVLLSHEVLCEPGAQALGAIGGTKAAAALRGALGDVKGKRRVTIITALGHLRDAEAAEAIRKAATDSDRDVRLAALYALANAGDVQAIDICIKAASAKAPFERSQAVDACILLARRLTEAGQTLKAATMLARMADSEQNEPKRHEMSAILQTLAETGDPKVVADMMGAMDDKDQAIRVPAARTAVGLAQSLASTRKDDATKLLGKAITSTSEEAVIQEAKALLATLGG